MKDRRRIAERSIAFFLLGVVLLSPPLLGVFGSSARAGGIPLLYLWLFAVWALLILLIGWTAGSPGDRDR